MNQSDHAYYRFFREHSTRELAWPYISDDLWERVVLQACHEEPSIRALAASVGALQLSINSDSTAGAPLLDRSHAPTQQTVFTGSHYLYALNQYGRGLTGIRGVVESQQPGAARHALIAAILIYCFESIYNGPENAVLQFERALHFLSTELARVGRPYRHLSTSSPTPEFEHELIAGFVRLNSSLMARPAGFTSKPVQKFLVTCDFSDQAMPPSFSSIDEARKYFEQAQFSYLPELLRSWFKAMNAGHGGLVLSDDILTVTKQMSVKVARWVAAFEPIFDRAVASHSRGGPFSAEFTLQLQVLASNLSAQALWSLADDAHQHRTPARDLVADCDAINKLAREIAAEPSFKRTFVWNSGFLQALTATITAAPMVTQRVEALRIVKSVRPRREGAYDSVTLVEPYEYMLRAGFTLDLRLEGVDDSL